MDEPALEDLLSNARNKLHDENIVTLLGKPESGKTVAVALLKHALFDKFLPLRGGTFRALVEKGGERVDNILRRMQEDRNFPSSTRPVDAPQTEFTIYNMHGEMGGKSRLVLQDSSGEQYVELLDKQFDDPKERLAEILAANNENQDVGSLAPYVFSKVYLLVIECPPPNSRWELRHAARIIKSLKDVHEVANLTHNKKVMTDIAVLFTKADRLNDEDRNRPASELLGHIRELKDALEICHSGKLECFKLSIDTESEYPKDRDRRVIRERKEAQEDLERAQKEYDQRLKEHVAKSMTRAKKTVADQPRDAQKQDAAAASQAEQKFRSLHKAPTLNFDESAANKIGSKVNADFTYSQDEYVRLIGWIIDRLYD